MSKGDSDPGRHRITVTFDDSKTSVQEIQNALVRGGFPPEGKPKMVSAGETASEDEDEVILVGRLTKEQLYSQAPVFEEYDRSYQPTEESIDRIKQIDETIELIMFLGTWCPDSQKEAPKLLKILEEAGNPHLSMTIYGLDRDKKDPEGMAERYGIEKVPTTIFIRDGRELGRIVEYPKKSPEEDFLDIVSS